MKFSRVKRMVFVLACLFFGVMALSACSQTIESSTPTVLIHGAPGSDRSFVKTTELLASRVDVTKEPLMEVNADGKLIVHGRFRKGNNPLIVLRFTDSNADEDKRSEWLATCMRYLYQHEGVRQVNFIGHSMGGIDALYYATYYQNEKKDLPKVNKVVSLGAPFNGCDYSQNGSLESSLKHGPKEESQDYKTYAALMKKYPLKAKVWLNIAGDKLSDGKGDMIVPLGSVACITPLMKKEKIHYEFEVFKGDEHSELHDDKRVIDRIVQFLWE